jgi:type II secretory pathway pseudopilin PulG
MKFTQNQFEEIGALRSRRFSSRVASALPERTRSMAVLPLKRRERRAPITSSFTDHASRITRSARFDAPQAAFTMIEIAISLAVIAFALVAIIGILPTGMQVQKDNRQETIINQDATIFLDAIKNGVLGMDDLTNYVFAITNYSTTVSENGSTTTSTYGYTYSNSTVNGAPLTPSFPIINGARIIGLLSTPRYMDASNQGTRRYTSNYVVAFVRSMSGAANEKFPQTNSAMGDLSFNYRVACEVAEAAYYDAQWTNYAPFPTNSPEYQQRFRYAMVSRTLQTNLHDLRLVFRWPLFNNNTIGNGKQTYRTMVGGHLMQTNDFGYPNGISNLYFFQPRNYVKAQ